MNGTDRHWNGFRAMLQRARVLRERGRFCARELMGRKALRRYRLAPQGPTVFVRHRTDDLYALDEVFVERDYAAPPEPARLLASLPRPRAVIDLGANIGLFGAWAAAELGAERVIAFEPDPTNAQVLARCAAANPAVDWRLIRACASNADGTVQFQAGDFVGSRIVESGGVPVPARDIFAELDSAALLKMDIEGGEWAILRDPRFEQIGVPVLVVEYHPHLCPSRDPRRAAADALAAAGYEIAEAHHDTARGQGVVWGWRSS